MSNILFQCVENPTYNEIKDVLLASGFGIGIEVRFIQSFIIAGLGSQHRDQNKINRIIHYITSVGLMESLIIMSVGY